VLADRLPSGIVTFVFTDIEGSTRLLRQLGARYEEVLLRHRALVGTAVAAHAGHVVSTQGDGMLLAFADPICAVRACADAQRALAAQAWPSGGEVKVRVGVHCGLASPRGGDYVALAVHQAARVMAAAHGGQILVSDDVLAAVDTVAGAEIVLLGHYRLRDFDAPVGLHEVRVDGLHGAAGALRAVPADGHNLVRPATSFVGRAGEVAQARAALRGGAVVTLVGPGGVGKTRLAIELGLAVALEWPDGVWMVDLAPLAEPDLVAGAVADALGAPAAAVPSLERVLDHVRPRSAVVVLDNCEHLVGAAAAVASAIAVSAPGVAVVATSREPLGVPGEVIVRLAPLAVPSPDAPTDAIAAAPAVALLLERAGLVAPDALADIVALCQRLDGLPLALEMAAARLRVQRPEEILRGLMETPLRTPVRAVPERHRSLEALLTWGEELLEDDERRALHRLALLPAGFDLAVATAAVGPDAPRLIWALADKSLVHVDLTANATRYRLLETVRSFALDRLHDEGEVVPAAAALAAWYLERLGSGRRIHHAAADRLATELDNLRSVLAVVAGDDEVLAQQLAVVIARHHNHLGSGGGTAELARLLAELRAPTPARAELLVLTAQVHERRGDLARCVALLSEAAALSEALGVPRDLKADKVRGLVLLRQGDAAGAVEVAREGLAVATQIDDEARLWNLLGIAVMVDDPAASYAAFQHQLALEQQAGNDVDATGVRASAAEAAMRLGETQAAAQHQLACLDDAVALGWEEMVAYSMLVAARLAVIAGDWPAAARLDGRAARLLEAAGLVLYDADLVVAEQLRTDGRARLGESQWDAAAAEGVALSLSDAVALARGVLVDAAAAAPGVRSSGRLHPGEVS
jgi:predicted ATPase/class 3 adenylate cyclase